MKERMRWVFMKSEWVVARWIGGLWWWRVVVLRWSSENGEGLSAVVKSAAVEVLAMVVVKWVKEDL